MEKKPMEKVAFKMKLKPGFKEEYQKRHNKIWPELSALLKANGISDYTIFLDEETNILFAVQMLSGQSSQELGETEIVKKWWAYMADIMDTNPDNSPQSTPLTKVFHLD
jgi:L-rhamnose mutarotase